MEHAVLRLSNRILVQERVPDMRQHSELILTDLWQVDGK